MSPVAHYHNDLDTSNSTTTNTSPTSSTTTPIITTPTKPHNATTTTSSSPPLVHSLSDDSFNDLPLSMRFMHKPSRSRELLEKASDPTRRNSLLNTHIDISDPGDVTDSPPITQSLSYSPPPTEEVIHDDDEPGYRLVRKKSGEILKPSLKSNDSAYFDIMKRSRSLPTTPTYKQVHFGGGNDVRYFKKKDKPAAISASNSPTLNGDGDDDTETLKTMKKLNLSAYHDYDDDEDDDDDEENDEDDDEFVENNVHGETKYPRYAEVFDSDSEEDSDSDNNMSPHYKYQAPPKSVDWQLKLLNFTPLTSYDSKIKQEVPVFLERLFITVDKKYLLGHIAVKNLAFEKYLIVRYSLDNWCTIIEIPTVYVPDRPEILKSNNYDRFIFQIPLENLFNSFRISSTETNNNNTNNTNTNGTLEKTYQICIKYYSNRNEYWDNNSFKNYHIKLIRTTREAQKSRSNNNNNKHHITKLSSPPPPADYNPPKNSRISSHDKKPKYSHSYLKRIVSDSQIELNKKDEDTSSSDINDFEKNNFYMSSPMLSSYNTKPKVPGGATTTNNNNNNNNNNNSTITAKPNDSVESLDKSSIPSAKSSLSSPPFTMRHDDSSDISPDTAKPERPPFGAPPSLDPQSYRELLDNYCFFNSSNPSSPDTHPTFQSSPVYFGAGHLQSSSVTARRWPSASGSSDGTISSRNTSNSSTKSSESDVTIRPPPSPPTSQSDAKQNSTSSYTISSFLGI
ncbi:putative phosphatase regulatory subunit-domain-containing protein [Scheffersomyces amazonensis]|uniref:putative phosphatase regulatory subunit-domain-containing protein n=1 Tax=Scheffersomyces amazonensis TaxID=1078765 RepID=UPI00315D5D45